MPRRSQPRNRKHPKPLPYSMHGQRVNVNKTQYDLHKKQASGKVFENNEELGQWN